MNSAERGRADRGVVTGVDTQAGVRAASILGGSPPVPVLPPELGDSLREDLRGAGYTVEGIAALLGPVASAAVRRDRLEPARRVLDAAGPGVLSTILRVFALGDPATAAELDVAFPAWAPPGSSASVSSHGSGPIRGRVTSWRRSAICVPTATRTTSGGWPPTSPR